ncbi:unnamed protein product, partial [Owenia fusiformis]
ASYWQRVQVDICLNNGTCVHNGTSANDTYCCCAQGFEGDRCQIEKDECAFDPCQNNGTCIDTADSYTCNCTLGYSGTNCEDIIDMCNPNPCQNNAQCFTEGNTFNCNCTDNFFNKTCGTYCEPRDDCGGHYTCDETDGSFDCLSGWTGDACNIQSEEPLCTVEEIIPKSITSNVDIEECLIVTNWRFRGESRSTFIHKFEGCTGTTQTLCEVPKEGSECPSGFTITVGQSCYFMNLDWQTSHANANATCASFNASFAHIETPFEMEQLGLELAKFNDTVRDFKEFPIASYWQRVNVDACLNNATCVRNGSESDDFYCCCADGFEGKACNETNINMCDPNP